MTRFMTNRFEILVKPNSGIPDIKALVQKLGPYHAHLARADKRTRKEYRTSDGAYMIVCTNSEKRNVTDLLQAITASGFTLADEKFQALLIPVITMSPVLAAQA